jgi:nitroimidazol reductase NimA-like FMN-containing flavoprotein (pyridoxamine 5'-phosphate oxidase superfamily)
MRLTKRMEKLIGRERVCRVATTGTSGVPHVVPVVHVLVDGKVCFASERTAKKVEHLRTNPYAAVTVDLYAEDWSGLKGVMVQGPTRLIDGGPRFRKLRKLLYEKYPQYPEETAIEEGDVIVEITPRHVFAWGLG